MGRYPHGGAAAAARHRIYSTAYCCGALRTRSRKALARSTVISSRFLAGSCLLASWPCRRPLRPGRAHAGRAVSLPYFGWAACASANHSFAQCCSLAWARRRADSAVALSLLALRFAPCHPDSAASNAVVAASVTTRSWRDRRGVLCRRSQKVVAPGRRNARSPRTPATVTASGFVFLIRIRARSRPSCRRCWRARSGRCAERAVPHAHA